VSNAFETILLELAEVFDRERIDYMVIGGLAVGVWGVQRYTKDADIAVAVDAHEVGPLLTALEPHVEAILPNAAELAADTGIIRFRHRTGVGVDLGVSVNPYLLDAIARAVKVDVRGRQVKFCTAEDLILHKLLADRDQDRIDIRGIIRRQGDDLDRALLDPLVDQLAKAAARPEILRRYLSLF
jgi:hypothetical protein